MAPPSPPAWLPVILLLSRFISAPPLGLSIPPPSPVTLLPWTMRPVRFSLKSSLKPEGAPRSCRVPAERGGSHTSRDSIFPDGAALIRGLVSGEGAVVHVDTGVGAVTVDGASGIGGRVPGESGAGHLGIRARTVVHVNGASVGGRVPIEGAADHREVAVDSHGDRASAVAEVQPVVC